MYESKYLSDGKKGCVEGLFSVFDALYLIIPLLMIMTEWTAAEAAEVIAVLKGNWYHV